jgi:hypothetical protein
MKPKPLLTREANRPGERGFFNFQRLTPDFVAWRSPLFLFDWFCAIMIEIVLEVSARIASNHNRGEKIEPGVAPDNPHQPTRLLI